MDFSDVRPSEITFRRQLFRSRFSVIFLVEIRNKTCVMKVHHDPGPMEWTPPGRQTDIHICELTAYRRLKEYGVCDRGIVPQFYGTLERLDVSDPHYQPHLRMFLEDEYPPNAIFLEYIPNMEMIYPEHYTKKRAEALVRGIHEIHKALILHSDAKPRNIMIVGDDDPERVVWLDFDRAQTYNPDTITEREKTLIEEEGLMMEQFAEYLEIDQARGKLDDTYIFYCT